MTTSTLDKRLDESREARQQFWQGFTLEGFGTVASLIALFVLIGGLLLIYGNIPDLRTLATDFYANISSELASIVITVLIVDRLNRQREKRDNEALQKRLDEQELTRLKALLGSNENVVAKIAVAELRAKGWLADGTMQEVDLRGANLQGADLSGVHLINADMRSSILQGINLKDAHLEGINLSGANLEKADLRGANLSNSKLSGANLSNSILWNTKIDKADLRGANLQNSNLSHATLNQAMLQAADLSNSISIKTQFKKAILIETQFLSADLRDAILNDADLRGASFEKANLWGASLQGTNLWGANLKGADLRIMQLQSANVWNVQCDANTILPNQRQWTRETDWSKFDAVEIESSNKWRSYRKTQSLLRYDNDTE
ncbi:MAG: pentapeptide repeat-containing protein [Chloroflexota bacterium]